MRGDIKKLAVAAFLSIVSLGAVSRCDTFQREMVLVGKRYPHTNLFTGQISPSDMTGVHTRHYSVKPELYPDSDKVIRWWITRDTTFVNETLNVVKFALKPQKLRLLCLRPVLDESQLLLYCEKGVRNYNFLSEEAKEYFRK